MKTFLFLLLILLLYPFQQTFSQIKTGGTIELGYEDRSMFIKDTNGNTSTSPWLRRKDFMDIHFDAGYRKFLIYTNVKTFFEAERIYRYNPRQVQYILGASYQLKRFSFHFEHLCSHSMMDRINPTFESFYDTYDRVSVKVKLWGD